jgi:hypothetical protein
MSNELSPVDQILDDIAEAMEAWAIDQRANIARNVTERLNVHRDKVLMQLLGFEKDSWAGDQWKIDHCNGRAGNSPIGDFLKTAQEAAIKEWLTQIPLPTMTPKMKANFSKELRYEYTQTISYRLRDMAHTQAERDLAELLKEVLSPTLLQKMQRTHALIAAPSSSN